MEREIHMPPTRRPEARHSLAHLLGRLVGEGDRQNLAGLGEAPSHEVRDAIGNDAGLSRARASEYQEWPARVEDGLSLGRIEGLEEIHHEVVVSSQ
jgi:hypothetical protein